MNQFDDSLEIDESIVKNFQILDVLGRGAYGIVWKVQSIATGECFALKKIFQAFQNSRDAQRTYREAMGLKQLTGHPNIVSLLDLIQGKNKSDLYLLFEYVDTDLHKFLTHLKETKTPITLDQIKKIMLSICRGLEFLHDRCFMHRDLKPANILLSNDLEAKICDFGCSRYYNEGLQCNLTDYIATRWYRAPEMIFRSSKYTDAVDVWALGCLLAEMFLGGPLFPGSSTVDQLQRIFSVLGKPKPEELEDMKSKIPYSQIEPLQIIKVKNLQQMVKHIPSDAQDFIKKCLQYSPLKRPKVGELLKHKFLSGCNQSKYVKVEGNLVLYGLDDPKRQSTKYYRDIITNTIMHKKKNEMKIRKLHNLNINRQSEDLPDSSENIFKGSYFTQQQDLTRSVSQVSQQQINMGSKPPLGHRRLSQHTSVKFESPSNDDLVSIKSVKSHKTFDYSQNRLPMMRSVHFEQNEIDSPQKRSASVVNSLSPKLPIIMTTPQPVRDQDDYLSPSKKLIGILRKGGDVK